MIRLLYFLYFFYKGFSVTYKFSIFLTNQYAVQHINSNNFNLNIYNFDNKINHLIIKSTEMIVELLIHF